LVFKGLSISAPREFARDVLNETPFSFILKKPSIWWPYHLGEPSLYSFSVRVFPQAEDQLLDERIVTIGIRTVKLKNLE
jgi:beta-galactosidase/beta-glucuronidase